jgi:hypothetical protein
MTPDDDRLLQDILCGDASEDDPVVAARLKACPRLARDLAALRRLAADLDACASPSPERLAEARRHATPRYRSMLENAFVPRRSRRLRLRAWHGVAAIAAAALVAALVLGPGRQDGVPRDGRLGQPEPLALERQGEGWVLNLGATIPPGSMCRLRLELASGAHLEASTDSPSWTFPDAWTRSLEGANSARLVVEWDDGAGLYARRVLFLR